MVQHVERVDKLGRKGVAEKHRVAAVVVRDELNRLVEIGPGPLGLSGNIGLAQVGCGILSSRAEPCHSLLALQH